MLVTVDLDVVFRFRVAGIRILLWKKPLTMKLGQLNVILTWIYIGTSVPSSRRGAHGTGEAIHLARPSISQHIHHSSNEYTHNISPVRIGDGVARLLRGCLTCKSSYKGE